jgi:hypothetical protein
MRFHHDGTDTNADRNEQQPNSCNGADSWTEGTGSQQLKPSDQEAQQSEAVQG